MRDTLFPRQVVITFIHDCVMNGLPYRAGEQHTARQPRPGYPIDMQLVGGTRETWRLGGRSCVPERYMRAALAQGYAEWRYP